jgi:uncharacterized membrane protein
MVIPQFSLRMALALMALLGFVSLLIARGLRGSSWAMGVSIALAALVCSFLVYAMVFGIVYVASKAFNRETPRRLAKGHSESAVNRPLSGLERAFAQPGQEPN